MENSSCAPSPHTSSPAERNDTFLGKQRFPRAHGRSPGSKSSAFSMPSQTGCPVARICGKHKAGRNLLKSVCKPRMAACIFHISTDTKSRFPGFYASYTCAASRWGICPSHSSGGCHGFTPCSLFIHPRRIAQGRNRYAIFYFSSIIAA